MGVRSFLDEVSTWVTTGHGMNERRKMQKKKYETVWETCNWVKNCREKIVVGVLLMSNGLGMV